MKLLFLALFLPALTALTASADETKTPPWTKDSERQPGVPKGKVTRYEFRSQVFKDTLRQYYLYVPAQYDGTSPAAVMVFQDGHSYVEEKGQFRTPIVFDNLIAKKELPVTIGIFINPGLHVEKIEGRQSWGTHKNKSNRSVEYDSLGGKYAEFLEKEILPAVAKKYKLTNNPEQRAICGLSSGGICAFTAAWERPDLFRKVLSHIGSFANIRGGHVYPTLIRKEEIRPLRVYLQDGKNDLDNSHGNWWLGNQQMQRALEYRKYQHMWVPTEGGHSGKDGGRVFPNALRWLWKK